MKLHDLTDSSNALAPFYTDFNVSNRLLLTGHSHQAWPNCAKNGLEKAWQDAAKSVDQKWQLAFEKAEQVREGFRHLLDDPKGEIVLGASTHDLIVRFLSALPLQNKPRLVTTDGEFHSLRLQLDKLSEKGIEIVKIPTDSLDSISDRIISALDDRTSAVLVSSVFFETGRIVPLLNQVAEACVRLGIPFLVDIYHALNVVPFSVIQDGLESAFIVGGGYKYCQLGEGNCFLRLPPNCRLRPVITGWFSEIAPHSSSVMRHFAGSTYDPISHYRAVEVFRFFQENELYPDLLRQVSQHQLQILMDAFDNLDLSPQLITRDKSLNRHQFGGFLALKTPIADSICTELQKRGVFTDSRGEFLRFGPAPYLTDDQLKESMSLLKPAVLTNQME